MANGGAANTLARRTYFSSYAIFEGGGAKSIAHVGALRALERERQTIVGVAGTSAGAIIAALVAVGYTADEIFLSKDANILKALGSTPIDLLGRKGWARLRGLKARLTVSAVILILGLAIEAMTRMIARWLSLDGLTLRAIGLACIAIALLLICRSAWPLLSGWGMLDTRSVRRTVNEALRRKLRDHYTRLGISDPVPKTVLFDHIDPTKMRRCIPLKIVTTNVTTGALTVFDRRFANVPVADAVAASAALPFVFQPARIGTFSDPEDAVFADGGLVSNLPTWVFRDEKRMRERDETRAGGVGRIPIYAFTLSTPNQKTRDLRVPRDGETYSFRSVARYVRAVLSAGIFGSQAAIKDFVSDLTVINLNTDLETLDFDCSGDMAEAAVDSAYAQAAERLRYMRLRDDLTNTALKDILATVQTMIAKRRGQGMPRLRVTLIDPVCRSSEQDVVGFRVVAGAGMADDADDTLELDIRGKIAPAAFTNNEAVYGMIHGRMPGDLFMTKYEHAMMPGDLHSVIAVPIYASAEDSEQPRRILAVDSSDDLADAFGDATFREALTAAGAQVSKVLIDETIRGMP